MTWSIQRTLKKDGNEGPSVIKIMTVIVTILWVVLFCTKILNSARCLDSLKVPGL